MFKKWDKGGLALLFGGGSFFVSVLGFFLGDNVLERFGFATVFFWFAASCVLFVVLLFLGSLFERAEGALERRRTEKERRRKEEEKDKEEKNDAVDAVLLRLCLLSPRALLLLAAINKTRERLEVFDDSPTVRCGRLTFSHVEVDDLRRAGYLEKVEDNRGGARVVYRLTDQGAAAFLVGRSKGLFDGLEV